MDLKPVDLSEANSVENVSVDVTKEIVQPLTTEVELLTKENLVLIQQIEELKTITKMQAVMLEAKPTVDEGTIEKMKELETRLGQTLFDLDVKNKEYERDISARDATNQDLLVKLNELKSREPGYITKIEELTHEKDSALFKFEAIKKERDAVFFERDNLLRGVQDLKMQLAQVRESYEKVLPELAQSKTLIASLETEVKRLAGMNFVVQEENKTLHARIAELEIIRVDYENVKKLLGEMTIERNQLAKTLSLKEYEITGLRNDLNKYVSELQVKKQVIGHIVQAEEVLASDVNELQAEVNKRDQLIEDLVFKQNELKTNELKLNETIDSLRKEKESIIPVLDALKAENLHLRSDLARVVPERDELLNKLKQKEMEIVSINNDLQKLNKENLSLIASMTDLEKKRDAAVLALREKEAEIKSLKEELEQLRTELFSFKERVKFLETENSKLSELNKEQEKELLALKLKLQRIPQLENRIKELELSNEQLSERVIAFESVKGELIQARKDYESILLERDCLLATLRNKEAEITRLNDLLIDYETVKGRLVAAELENKRLTDLHIAESLRIQELETMVTNLQFSVKNEAELADSNEKLSQENAVLHQKVQDLEYNYTTLNTKYEKLEAIYAQIKGVTEHLGAVHETLVETCEETEKVEAKLKDTEIKQGHFIEQVTQEKKSTLHDPTLDQVPQRF